MLAFYNGEFIDGTEKIVSLEDRGYHFGDGVYEVIRVYNQQCFMLNEHLERLQTSASAVQIDVPYTNEQIKEYIDEGIKRLNEDNVDIYLQLTRGSAPRNHIFNKDIKPIVTMIFRKSKEIDKHIRNNGAGVILKKDERWANCYIKSLNLLPNILAKNEAVQKGCIEAVFYNDKYITEGSASNVFVVKNSELYTTPLFKGILPGITRVAVLQIASNIDMVVHEKFFSPQFLKEADECFITSTTSEVLPITTVDNNQVGDGNVGPWTKEIYKQFNNKKIGNKS